MRSQPAHGPRDEWRPAMRRPEQLRPATQWLRTISGLRGPIAPPDESRSKQPGESLRLRFGTVLDFPARARLRLAVRHSVVPALWPAAPVLGEDDVSQSHSLRCEPGSGV